MRATDTAAWQRARGAAIRAAGDSVLLVGHELRYGTPPTVPLDTAARVLDAAERAQLASRPLHFITDGEASTDMRTLSARSPAGSRVVVERVTRGADVAIARLDAPPAARAGDTLRLGVVVQAAERSPSVSELVVRIDRVTVARRRMAPLGANERRRETVDVQLTPGAAEAELAVVVASASDVEPRNDTASRRVVRGERSSAVAISTSPDFDFRELVRVLRGALSLPTSVRFRVAPSRWVDERGRPVAESQVRAEFARASVAVLHGDTAFFGPPRTSASGALALIPHPRDASEWYLTSALPSPLAYTLGGLAFDSLPPIAADRAEDGTPLLTGRGGMQRTQAIGSLMDSTRRIAVLPIRGTAGWVLRGGAAADAFATLWGSTFAALAERPGARIPVSPSVVPPTELQPQAVVLESGRIGEAAARGMRVPLRELGWPYVLLIALLCGEWLLRRRAGLR